MLKLLKLQTKSSNYIHLLQLNDFTGVYVLKLQTKSTSHLFSHKVHIITDNTPMTSELTNFFTDLPILYE